MYGPKGPVCDPKDRETLKFTLETIRDEARRRGAVFLRIDPNIGEKYFASEVDPFEEEEFIHLKQRWTFWNSPRDVYRIDLNKAENEDGLFMTIYRDARRCVRKSRKEGLTIEPARSIEDLRKFYEIFNEITVAKGFMCRQYRYQEALWNEYIARGNGRLFLGIYEGEIIGGIICLLFGKKCVAMHMGTPYRYQKLQTYYAYIWESMRWAKEQECDWYSFRGVGTTPTQEYFKKQSNPK